MPRPLVLASTSPYRKALLGRLKLEFVALAPDFAEVGLEDAPPRDVALAFAAGKAQSLAGQVDPQALVIGSDQTLEHQGRRLSKPPDLRAAAAQLHSLAGDTHYLHTGVAVFEPQTGRLEREVVTTELTLRPLTARQAEQYVLLDEPHGCVGGYAFEGRGVALFEDVKGSDDSAIVGLPLLALGRLLRALGVDPLGG